MIVSLIAAYAQDVHGRKVIGKDNKIPWHCPSDLRRFREYTLGRPIIMGSKTFRSIGRLLPGRQNIILSRKKEYAVEGASIFTSIGDALSYARTLDTEVFIIGGEEIYKQALNRADRIYLTEILLSGVSGDAFFPEFSLIDFREIFEEHYPEEIFRIYERVNNTSLPNGETSGFPSF